ncbi:MAG: hypothetical protein M1816_006809 [Peltula sp. TS41687]|nr:MAG: hypothetical protein M1816_006809 [Peltula sp. TS41687]
MLVQFLGKAIPGGVRLRPAQFPDHGRPIYLGDGEDKYLGDENRTPSSSLRSLWLFFYASFLKPHSGDQPGRGQQAALESFYKTQATVYDVTRKRLLRGREDMLGLVAAQLKHQEAGQGSKQTDRIWVDMGGGTGYNIEAMAAFIPVPEYFHRVYLVDLSPSLCEIARKRFARLGWNNVKVVCQDARSFCLEDYDHHDKDIEYDSPSQTPSYAVKDGSVTGRVHLVTLSYSLSMIPEFYSVIDSLSSLLSPHGILGVVDFYVQSIVDIADRNYTGGVFNRHVNWLGRVFWRAWFEVDRVGLEAARRDYLEYRYGTILSLDQRNYLLGGIPYYIWVGCQKEPTFSSNHTTSQSQEIIRRLDASVTESAHLPLDWHDNATSSLRRCSNQPPIRSKAFESAIINLSSKLPLPAFFYQNRHWRIYYEEHQPKHKRFNNEYIYAFTWEDVRTDIRLLKIREEDVILAITSAGDNILAYALEGPRRIHAVDLNPAQNHLLELKVASFAALDHDDVWAMFGEGRHEHFRDILISRLSPHMSSRAFQYWLEHAYVFTSKGHYGLYNTGGSRFALQLLRWLFRLFGLTKDVQRLCQAQTLNEQREIWREKIRKVLLNRTINRAVVATDLFLWKALGVPCSQRKLIEMDYFSRNAPRASGSRSGDAPGQAIWEYMVDTFDPVVEHTLIRDDNYFYMICLQGRYSKRCHPSYLSAKSHRKLSKTNAFDGLRIHTDDIYEVISRMMPETLTIAVIMDSMDWFDLTNEFEANQVTQQVSMLNRTLKLGGRVLLRSAAINPWYMETFARLGFSTRSANVRLPGTCVDRYVQ